MGEAAKELSKLLTESDVLRRKKLIGDALNECPDVATKVIAHKYDIGKSIIKHDIDELFKEGHPGAVKRKENNFYRVRKKIEIEKALKENPFADQIELAREMKMKYSEFRGQVKDIRKEVAAYDKATSDIVSRRNEITEYMAKYPGKSLAEVSLELEIPLDQIAKDQEAFDDPKYNALETKHRIVATLAAIADDMEACETQFKKCVEIDPRSGSRWKEEKRKYRSLFIDLAKLLGNKGLDVNLSIQRSPDEREAILKAAKLKSA